MWESCIDSAALSYVSSVLCVSRLISLHFCPNALPRKQRRPRAEEFGVYSNFSCQAVSTWSWFSSPMQVWWVMLLGRNWFVSKSLEPCNQLLFPWEKSLRDCQCKCCGQVFVPIMWLFFTFSNLWVCVSQKRGLTGCKSSERPAAAL